MRIVFEQGALARAVQSLQSIAATKNTLPILANVLLDARENTIVMAATDLEVGIRMTVEGSVEESGILTIPARKFSELVRELPNEEVHLSTTSNDQIQIECGPVLYKMFGLPADEFPKMSTLSDEYFMMEADDLRRMMLSTRFAASSGETQYFLNGVYLDISASSVRMVATDSRRLAMAQLDIEGVGPNETGVIIPIKAVDEFVKNFPGSGEIRVCVQDNEILFANDESTLSGRLVDGEYPKYEQIIPTDNPIHLVADREALLTAVRRVSLFSNPKTLSVRMKLTETSLVVSARTPDFGEAREELAVTCSEPIEIGFNAQFLRDALSAIESEAVRMEFKEPVSAAVIKPGEQDNYLCLLMPMRVE